MLPLRFYLQRLNFFKALAGKKSPAITITAYLCVGGVFLMTIHLRDQNFGFRIEITPLGKEKVDASEIDFQGRKVTKR